MDDLNPVHTSKNVEATLSNATKSNVASTLLLVWTGLYSHVTCGLTVCTPGSSPGPTLGNEYGRPLPFTILHGDIVLLFGVTLGLRQPAGSQAGQAYRSELALADRTPENYLSNSNQN